MSINLLKITLTMHWNCIIWNGTVFFFKLFYSKLAAFWSRLLLHFCLHVVCNVTNLRLRSRHLFHQMWHCSLNENIPPKKTIRQNVWNVKEMQLTSSIVSTNFRWPLMSIERLNEADRIDWKSRKHVDGRWPDAIPKDPRRCKTAKCLARWFSGMYVY